MTERSAPAHALASQIAVLEAEMKSALAACPSRQRFEIELLRRRLAQLKAAAPSLPSAHAHKPRVSLR